MINYMTLSFKFVPKLNNLQKDIIEDLSFHTTKLYNIVSYDLKNSGFKNYFELNKLYKTNWHREYLHSHNYQHCLKILEQNWKSYFASIKDFKANPRKYKGTPRPPKFKNLNYRKNEVVFTNLAIRFKNNILMLSLSKKMQLKHKVNSLNFEVSAKLQSLVNWSSIQQIKISWNNSKKIWELNIIYRVKRNVATLGTNIMSIDLGLNNLATITFKDNKEAYILDGKALKSKNCYLNKKIAYLQGIVMKQTGSSYFKNTKQINSLWRYRTNYMKDYLHKASATIIKLVKTNQVGTIIIGDIKNIKQDSTIKNFNQVPLAVLVNQIKYKADLIGIKVILLNEAYTSGVSALDLEPISKVSYNKSRRVTRGLFKTNTNILVNSDVNGSLNIMRKYLKDKCIPRLLEVAKGNGFVNNPIRIRVA